MNEGQPASPVQGNPDDKPSRSSADVPEVSRSEADAGSDPVAEQINPSLSGLDTGGSPQTGAIASLLSKIPALPIEVVRALEEFRTSIDERVVAAINAFLAEFGARMVAHDAKAEARMVAHDAKAEASQAALIARMDALDAKFESVRREVRLVLAVLTVVVALFGALVYLGFTDRASVRNASTTSATQQAETPVADAVEQTTATSIPALGTSSASEDVAAPNDDAAKTDGSSLPTDP